MPAKTDYLDKTLAKVARRYEQRGRLNGVIKIGASLNHDDLQSLHNFFGVEPIRINGKEEVRLHLDIALKIAPEQQWLKHIGSHLGYTLKPKAQQKTSEQSRTVISRLQLAFPELNDLMGQLDDTPEDIERMLANSSLQEVTDLCFQTAETVRYLLKNDTPVTVSELGARFFNDSKTLRQGEIRKMLLRWLNAYFPDLDSDENEQYILATYNVYHDRLTVNAVLYGPIIYTKKGKEFDWIFKLYQQGEAATISWANIQGIEQMRWEGSEGNPTKLICCENEAPFSRLIRQQANDTALLFTSGFPGSAVRKVYELLAPRAASCHHWGDTDPNGLRIASILHSIYPLQLYRCDIDTLHLHKKFLLPLSQKQKDAIMAILLISDFRFPFREELEFTLSNGWLEQENWRTVE